MAQPRRVPDGNTVEFVDATPRGLVDVENHQHFMEASPVDFMDALTRANEAAALGGGKFLAIRALLPRNLENAPDSVQFNEGARIAYDAWILGRVDRIAGAPEPNGCFIYLILTETIAGQKVMDRRGVPPCPEGFLEATSEGFKGANPRSFLRDAPKEFLDAFKKAEKEAPGQFVGIRVPMDEGMAESEAVEAIWKAWQINHPIHGPFAGKRVDRKEDLTPGLTVFSHGIKRSFTGDAKIEQKKGERAAGGGGIAGSHNTTTAVGCDSEIGDKCYLS